ncbi:MAG: YggU family protein [Desulfobacterales bacterium]|nr:MAG: YggU family protein [Desulfobacterales bacterium]
MLTISETSEGNSCLDIYVQPRSSRNKICGIHGSALKIAVTSPPVDGKANEALTAFLAKELGMPRRKIFIESGIRSRRKKIVFTGIGREELVGILNSFI